MQRRISVLIADDHAIVRQGLRALLTDSGEVEVVGEAATGREAVEQAASLKPAVVVMDLTMPDLNGIEATREIGRKHPETGVVLLSMHADAEYVHRAVAAGASGYLLKDSQFDEIIGALRAAAGGLPYFGAGVPRPAAAAGEDRSPLERLSARERQVLQLVVEGHTSADIASTVHLSLSSVETYRCRVMKKLGTRDMVSLVKFAIQHGLTGTR